MNGEAEADDFEKAILIVFAQNGLVDPSLKVSDTPPFSELQGVPVHNCRAVPEDPYKNLYMWLS